ncbi:MAG: tetratricopeptide repeat protein [Candidatus Hydrogenedentes bacterium]|nr:tetratricopeptide repeat protein [Candidatus Hydrogenedentota bacterium]
MIVTALVLLGVLGADAYQETFEEANRAYYQGDFAAAARGYEQLSRGRVEEAAIYHNLGNCYFRLEQLGPAIANYERALALEPGLAPTRENLQRAVEKTAHVLARPRGAGWRESLLFWDSNLRFGAVRNAALFFWAGAWALLGLWVYRLPRYVRPAAALCLILSLFCALSAWQKAHPLPLAVAIAPEVPVRYGMSEREKERYMLAEGDRVYVEAEENGWIRIATASGERGWAQAASFQFVSPAGGATGQQAASEDP